MSEGRTGGRPADLAHFHLTFPTTHRYRRDPVREWDILVGKVLALVLLPRPIVVVRWTRLLQNCVRKVLTLRRVSVAFFWKVLEVGSPRCYRELGEASF